MATFRRARVKQDLIVRGNTRLGNDPSDRVAISGDLTVAGLIVANRFAVASNINAINVTSNMDVVAARNVTAGNDLIADHDVRAGNDAVAARRVQVDAAPAAVESQGTASEVRFIPEAVVNQPGIALRGTSGRLWIITIDDLGDIPLINIQPADAFTPPTQ